MSKKVMIVGRGKVGKSALEKIAMTDIGIALGLQGEVRLKECHKTPEQKRSEAILKLRQELHDGMIYEYILIKQKKSKLSRRKRDSIVYKVEYYAKKGLLTEDELKSITE